MRKMIGAVAVGVLLAGCAGSRSTVDMNEDFLAEAGFRVLASNTQGYVAAQQQLPPHKFVHHTDQGVVTYYYYDPTICGCLYYGGQQNWDAYSQLMADRRHMQAEQLLIRADTPYTGQGGI
jgi:hypothetical protein